MQTVYIAGGCKSNTAVNILKGHLEAKGHRVTRDSKDPEGWDCTMRWGISYHGDKPAINARVNEFDKLEALLQFERCGIAAPYVIPRIHDGFCFEATDFPVLARNIHHAKGTDIVVCHNLHDVATVEGKDFFTPWIPTKTEYRVWVFLGNAFAVYEKEFKGEGEYRGFNRNRRMGFKFVKHDELRVICALTESACKAVRALHMDFGAVDVLLGKDGKYYVLEVNSMPYIDSSKRSTGIRLAERISQWVEGKYEHAD